MSESMIGKWLYVCNCGTSCKCGWRSEVPGQCPCNNEGILRRVLAEDELHFYVCQTGSDVENCNELGSEAFHDKNGRPLQAFRRSWMPKKDKKMSYRGMDVGLTVNADDCTVEIAGRTFSAMRHEERGIEGWMGYPCYVMFESPEAYARALVNDWHVIGDVKNLAPPDGSHGHGSSQGGDSNASDHSTHGS